MNDIDNNNQFLQLNEDFINTHEFLVADIIMDGEQHFLLATEYKLGILQEAKRWYVDGTFKVLGEPFRQQGQLMSMHAFIKRNGAHKQSVGLAETYMRREGLRSSSTGPSVPAQHSHTSSSADA